MSDVLPPHRTRRQGSAKPLWSDGIHFVRPAAENDRRTMRFVVGHHKTTASTYKRYAPTKEEAIEHAIGATMRWLIANPADLPQRVIPETPETTEATLSATPKKVVLQPFPLTRFDCTYANPVAQVWECKRHVGEYKPVGRPKKNKYGGRGADPVANEVHHLPGDHAVMHNGQPLRDAEGHVRAFTEFVAVELADILYADAPEDERITWKSGNTRVGSTPNIEIIFDPHTNGHNMPFSLYLPAYSRPVYKDSTHQTKGKRRLTTSKLSGQLAIDVEAARSRERSEDRQPSFEEKTLRFRSIDGAFAEADRREKMLRGEYVR